MSTRITGTFEFPSNFEVKKQAPLDARLTTPLLSELTDSSIPFPYEGMPVVVTGDLDPANNGLYTLSAPDHTDINNWSKLANSSSLENVAYTNIDNNFSAKQTFSKVINIEKTANSDSAYNFLSNLNIGDGHGHSSLINQRNNSYYDSSDNASIYNFFNKVYVQGSNSNSINQAYACVDSVELNNLNTVVSDAISTYSELRLYKGTVTNASVLYLNLAGKDYSIEDPDMIIENFSYIKAEDGEVYSSIANNAYFIDSNISLPSKFGGDFILKDGTYSSTFGNGPLTSNVDLRFPDASGTIALVDTNNNFSVAQTFVDNVTIQGNLNVTGSTVQIDSQVVTADSVILMNDGEVGNGVTSGYSGFQIDRGVEDDFWFGFDEVRDRFTIGKITSLDASQIATTQVVATRSDSIVDQSIVKWDSTLQQFVDGGKSITDLDNIAYTDIENTFTQDQVFSSNINIGDISKNSKLNLYSNNNSTALSIDFPKSRFDFSSNSSSNYTTDIHMDDEGLDIGHDSTSRSLKLKTGTLDRVTIKGTGEVGIGTDSPTEKLSVDGNVGADEFKVSDGDLNAKITNNRYVPLMISNSSGYSHARINGFEVGGSSDSSDEGYIKTSDNSRVLSLNPQGWEFKVLSNVLMKLDPSGNLGIGTTSPTSKVHISGTSDGSGGGADAILHVKQNGSWTANEPWALYVEGYSYLNGFRINAEDGTRALFKTTSGGTLGFATIDTAPITFTQSNSQEKMRIHSNGNVGIGTTSPSEKLEVSDGDIIVKNNSVRQYKWQYDSNQPTWSVGGGNYCRIYKDNAVFFHLSDSGKLGIGTASPSEKLEVDGNIKANNLILESTSFTSTISQLAGISANRSYSLPDASGTIALTSDVEAVDTSEWVTYSGTRGGGDLIVSIGDYDYSGDRTKIVINDGNQSIKFSMENENVYEFTVDEFKTPFVSIYNDSGFKVGISPNNITANRVLVAPDASGTIATEEYVDSKAVSIQDETGVERFKSNTIQFEGVEFDSVNNRIKVEGKNYANTYYIDTTLSDSNNSLADSIGNPFHSLEAVYSNLPTDNGKFIRIAVINSSNSTIGGTRLEARNTIFENLTNFNSLTIDFSNVTTPQTSSDNSVVDKTNASSNVVFDFPTGDIILKTDFDGVQTFSNYGKMVFKGRFGMDWNASNFNIANGTGAILSTDMYVDFILTEFTLYDRMGGYVTQFANKSNIVVEDLKVESSSSKIFSRGLNSTSSFNLSIIEINLNGNVKIGAGDDDVVTIGDVNGTGEVSVPSVFFDNSELGSNVTLSTVSTRYVSGNIVTDTNFGGGYNVGETIFENFSGRLDGFKASKIIFKGDNSIRTSGSFYTGGVLVCDVGEGFTNIISDDVNVNLFDASTSADINLSGNLYSNNSENVNATITRLNTNVESLQGEFELKADSTTSITLSSADKGKVISADSSSAITFTIDLNSLTDIGDIAYVDQMGSGEITFVASGVTLQVNSSRELKTDGQFSRVAIHKTGTTTYRVFGELK